VVTAVVLLAVFWLIRPGKNSAIAMGPMPSREILSDPIERRMARDMRAWVQNLKPQDVETLKTERGGLFISWEQLKVSYPAQAVLVDNYLEKIRIKFAEEFRQQGKPVPERLARHRNPYLIEITGAESEKAYWIIMIAEDGKKTSVLQISQ
jgi:hypothetical protein